MKKNEFISSAFSIFKEKIAARFNTKASEQNISVQNVVYTVIKDDTNDLQYLTIENDEDLELMSEDNVCDIIINHKLCEIASDDRVQGSSLMMSSLSTDSINHQKNDNEQ